jgi:hypothetical protein
MYMVIEKQTLNTCRPSKKVFFLKSHDRSSLSVSKGMRNAAFDGMIGERKQSADTFRPVEEKRIGD